MPVSFFGGAILLETADCVVLEMADCEILDIADCEGLDETGEGAVILCIIFGFSTR